MPIFRPIGLRFLALGLVPFSTCCADVKMPAIFGHHMVLQQDVKLPVWGWADAGEVVTVTLGTHSGKATADGQGKWRVDLDPVAESSTPLVLTVAGKNSLKFDDVLVGDVWVCSGQSNMEYPLSGAHNAATEVPKAADPQIRFFVVAHKIAFEPETDVKGAWRICAPDTIRSFSAVGYFFGRELRRKINRPIGLIGTYWGGTVAQAWTSLAGLEKNPPFANYVAAFQKAAAAYPQAKEAYPARFATYEDGLKKWEATDGGKYDAEVKKYHDAIMAARANGQPDPPRVLPPADMPVPPALPEGRSTQPVVLYNGMIAPLIPYGIKGVVWCQGESNGHNGIEYATLFPRMISDWREKWNEGDFPFVYVQLANSGRKQDKPSEGGWAYVREAQLKTLSLPKTGMASAIDIGFGELHPKDKYDLGLRLSLVARHVAYGEKLICSGPLYDSMKIDGNKIRLSFKEVGGGLKIGAPPWTPPGETAPPPTELTSFAVAGDDKKWVWAKAQIEGEQVVVSSDQVAKPVAVRYGWSGNPACDLYNQEGLPASPFRTDDWVLPETGSGIGPDAPPETEK